MLVVEIRMMTMIELIMLMLTLIMLIMLRTDNTGRTWCYTTGWSNSGCGDLQTSKRFPNNPWSYTACGFNG